MLKPVSLNYHLNPSTCVREFFTERNAGWEESHSLDIYLVNEDAWDAGFAIFLLEADKVKALVRQGMLWSFYAD